MALSVIYDASTAALQFKEFSYIGKDGTLSIHNITGEHLNALLQFLVQEWDAVVVEPTVPTILIGCHGDPPPENQRPFSVAGLIAIWKRADNCELIPIVGVIGHGAVLPIHQDIYSQLVPMKVPPESVILYLANEIFTDCIAISLLWQTLVVELPMMSEEKFFAQLHKLPTRIQGTGLILTFHSGPLTGTPKAKRSIRSEPRNDPGCMIASREDEKISTMATAGILVRKGRERRLACPVHLSHERIGNTDIGLAQLLPDFTFTNVFMDSTNQPKRFAHSSSERVGNRYTISSCTTGKEQLLGYGARFSLEREIIAEDDSGCREESPNIAHIRLKQGVYLSNNPHSIDQSVIRDGRCGAVLLKCWDVDQPLENAELTMERGIIAGMIRYADTISKDPCFISSYLCYADTFDELMEAGWEIACSQEVGSKKGPQHCTEDRVKDNSVDCEI